MTLSFVVSVAFQEKPEVVKSKISKRPIMQLSPSTPQDNDAPKSMETTSGERKSLWEGSSQYRHWRFSPETLLSQRTRINEAAVKAIRDTFEAQEVSVSRVYLLLPFLHLNSGRVFRWDRVFECTGGICLGQTLCRQDSSALRTLPLQRRGRVYGNDLSQEVLSS